MMEWDISTCLAAQAPATSAPGLERLDSTRGSDLQFVTYCDEDNRLEDSMVNARLELPGDQMSIFESRTKTDRLMPAIFRNT